MDNKYKDWIDMIKSANNALFVAFLAQIANVFYFNGALYIKIILYFGVVSTFLIWLCAFKLVSFLRKRESKNVN